MFHWQRFGLLAPHCPPFKVSICLYGLVLANKRMGDLLEMKIVRDQRQKWEEISRLIDRENNRYARTILSVGTHVEPPGSYTGGKIAFGRIPNMKDFI